MINKKNYFCTIGKGFGAPCMSSTKEEWEALRRESWLAEMCARIEKGEEQLKNQLPVWTPHCAEFKNNHRAIADAVMPLNRLMLDFDDKNHTDDIMSQLKVNSEQLKAAGIEVLLIEESVRRGTHVLVELPQGMTPEQAQTLMKEVTGFEPDPAVKDVSRCIYMVSEDHTKYVNEKLWTVSPLPSTINPESTTIIYEPSTINTKPLTFKGIPYSSIIKEWWYRNGGEPKEGERNTKLHGLAVNLRTICDNRKEVLMQVMPNFGLGEQEMTSIINSACSEQPKGISKMMKDIIQSVEQQMRAEEMDEEAVAEETGVKVRVKALPMGLKESLAGVPVSMHLPVLCSVLPIAAAYADQVEVEYCDGNNQHLGLMSIIYGEQASNKSVCKNAVNVWKRQFDAEDTIARQKEEEWKERKKSRKSNEKLPEDPKVLIRQVPVTVSCSTLLKRLKNAQGHTLYSFCEELDTLRKTNGAGSWSSKYDIYRLSFDRGEWGQDYNSDQAESGVVNVAYNWTMLGTKGAMRKCFRTDNIENGLSSRMLMAEMPDASFSKMPKFRKRTPEEEARIDEAVTKLRSYSGLIDVPRLRKGMENWAEEKRKEAAKDIDHVKDTYRKRAAVIGFRCGVVFYLLSMDPNKKDMRESRQCVDFAIMMAEYTLRMQMKTFGEAMRNEYANDKDECIRYGANHSIFDQLIETFSMDDLRSLKRPDMPQNSLNKIISRWHRDGWIERVDKFHWRKVTGTVTK